MSFGSKRPQTPPSKGGARLQSLMRRLFTRGIRFTRQGKLYTAVTLGVGLAAVNTGNNLLFLVLGLMLGLIVVSGILSEMSLRGLQVCRSVPETADAAVIFPVELSVQNLKRFTSSFGIELRDEIDGVPFRRRCFFLRIAPKESRAIAYRCEIETRGRAVFSGTVISTRFPFGLFEKYRFVSLEDTVVVLPKVVPVVMPDTASTVGDGIRFVQRAGVGLEFRELREMGSGDDPRRIDWRSTARLRRFMVRQNEIEGESFVEIVLDPLPAAGQDPEQNIARAASLIRLAAEREIPVRLVTVPGVNLECAGGLTCAPLLICLALLDITLAAQSRPPIGRSKDSVLIGPRASVRADLSAPLRGGRGAVERRHRGNRTF